jgi:hypothetical protein
MIHYHGLPITPATAAVKAVEGGHAFVSFAHSDQLHIAIDVCQSFALDNGAFSAWRSGKPVTDWTPFYDWALGCKNVPGCDFAVIPDVIDGSEIDNDFLLWDCPLPSHFGVPVWHMHETIDRLVRLANTYPRVCLGSSGDYSIPGTPAWWVRMKEALHEICTPEGLPITKLHGLRMLNPSVFTKLPLSSADSTNIGRNVGIDSAWKGTYTPPTKEARAQVMRQRIESHNSLSKWTR